MKNKMVKLLVLIVIIALVGGLIYFLVNKNKPNKTTEDVVKIRNINYFLYLGEGTKNTKYKGTETLFTGEKFTYNNISKGSILTAAFNYLNDNQKEENALLDPSLYSELNSKYDLTKYIAMKGELVRKAIKNLFGVDWENASYSDPTGNSIYYYVYDSESDAYLKGTQNDKKASAYLVYKVISNTKKDDKIITTVAIAFADSTDEGYDIYADPTNVKLITKQKVSSIEDLKDKEVDKLDKYNITSKLVDKNYVFDSIAPAK